MNYKEKIVSLLEENMTEKSFKFWKGINAILPDIWNRPTSSTGKYHKKHNGDVPTQGEHVYQMLYAAVRLLKIFNMEKKTLDTDKLLMSLVLHDSLKYGNMGTRNHTDTTHDKLAADVVESNKDSFLKLFNEDQFKVIVESIRFHSGRWSTDVPKEKEFSFRDYNIETMFTHILDMLSTQDLIQTDVRE